MPSAQQKEDRRTYLISTLALVTRGIALSFKKSMANKANEQFTDFHIITLTCVKLHPSNKLNTCIYRSLDKIE